MALLFPTFISNLSLNIFSHFLTFSFFYIRVNTAPRTFLLGDGFLQLYDIIRCFDLTRVNCSRKEMREFVNAFSVWPIA